jgi:hypothetical protein
MSQNDRWYAVEVGRHWCVMQDDDACAHLICTCPDRKTAQMIADTHNAELTTKPQDCIGWLVFVCEHLCEIGVDEKLREQLIRTISVAKASTPTLAPGAKA